VNGTTTTILAFTTTTANTAVFVGFAQPIEDADDRSDVVGEIARWTGLATPSGPGQPRE